MADNKAFFWYDSKCIDVKGKSYYHVYRGVMYHFRPFSCNAWVECDNEKIYLNAGLHSKKKEEYKENGMFGGELIDGFEHYCRGSSSCKSFIEWLLEDR